ncbi:hypothetical protein OIE66_19950 [Nonomuraea sp. NBC_01738]|uniref:hypothetical protein n=1 Tax=Nonomuraea sp. NBC_01738 TaxID=2976003 RepID=UPI002E120817|nr:hypothetical protein OIE66_19950 [Nonomuraea sp. NBC_01738]
MPDMRPIREDLQATLDARRDLGPDYEAALVESFVERLDATITARVQAELGTTQVKKQKNSNNNPKQHGGGAAMIPVALGSLGLGIPLTAIASSNAGLVGLLLTWAAIVAINVAAAVAIMRRD